MAREAYYRAAACYGDYEVTVGLEHRTDTHEDEILSLLKDWCTKAAPLCSDPKVLAYLEGKINKYYPDRAYFIETECDGVGVQVYDPRNFVKERCVCPCLSSE